MPTIRTETANTIAGAFAVYTQVKRLDTVLPQRNHSQLPAGMSDAICECADGQYQGDLIGGCETWSGSSLKGTASKWGARYAESRRNLLARIDRAVRSWGWTATTELVFDADVRRWRRDLVLWSPTRKSVHVW